MRVLNVLLCGGDELAMRKIAATMSADGVHIKIVNILADLSVLSERQWDFMLIDLDGLNSFLRSLLPSLSANFRSLPMIGLSRSQGVDIDLLQSQYGLALDGYVFEVPRPEDLIVSFPHVAAKYLHDTGTLYHKSDTQPLGAG